MTEDLNVRRGVRSPASIVATLPETVEPWQSTRQIARHLGLHPKTVLRLVHTRGLPTHRLGNRLRFKPSEVDRWLRRLGEED